MTLTIDKIDRVDFATKYKEESKELPVEASTEEIARAPRELLRLHRLIDATEADFTKVKKSWKAKLQGLEDEEEKLYTLIEEETKIADVPCAEFWGRSQGEPVLVLIRLDKFQGILTPECFVSMRFPQPEDRQASVPGTAPSSSDGAALKHGERAFEEGDEPVIPFAGAVEPEDEEGGGKRSGRGRRRSA